MTKELLAKANNINNRLMYVECILEDIKVNNSPITIQTGMAHNFQLDSKSPNTLDISTYGFITDILINYYNELKKEFELLTEED